MKRLKAFFLKFVFLMITSIVAAQNTAVTTDSLFNVLRNEKDDTKKLTILFSLYSLYSNKQWDSAISVSYQALRIAKSLDSKDFELQVNNNLGYAYYMIGNKAKMIEYSLLSLQEYNSRLDQEGAARIASRIALVYQETELYDEAILYYELALRNYQGLSKSTPGNLSYKIEHGNIRANIGFLYTKMERYDDAFVELDNSLQRYKEIQDTNGTIKAYLLLGNLFREQKNYKQALEYLNEAKTWSKNANNNKAKASCANNIADVYFSQQQYDEAIENYDEAEKLLKNVSSDYSKASLLTDYARALVKQGKNDDAEKRFKIALAIADSLNKLELKTNILSQYADILAAKNNHKEAFQMLKQLNTIHDTLETQKDRQIRALRVVDNSQLASDKELENLNLTLAQTIAEKAKYTQMALFGGAIFGSLLLIAFIVARIFRTSRAKK